ncbi:MAG: extracellular solute-binding protein [Acidimicrobiaceae bacterium]|nr:extracellular solute-binding protein [Acidimicrobiaceae bacterium]
MRSQQFRLGFRLLAALLALGLVAAACGDDAPETDDAALAQAQADAADAAAAASAAAAAAADAQAELEAAIAEGAADSEAIAALEAELTAAQEAAAEAAAAASAAAEEPMEEAMPELSGELVWWSDWTIEQTEAFIDAFNEVHPGIQVEYTRSDDAEMFDRFMTESEAGTIDADIAIIGWDGFSRIWESLGYLHAFDSPNKGNIPSDLRAASGAWYTYGTLLEGICYNTERIDELGLDPLETWSDLADPQYQDEIVMQDILKVGSGAHDMMIETRVMWDENTWEEFWAGYGANNVVFQPDYTAAQQQLVQGNFAVLGLCYLDFVQPSIDQGAPVVWVAPEFVITVGFTVNIPATSDNKENAEAFVNYIISEEGQAAVANIVGQVPAWPDAPYPEAALAAAGKPTILALGTPKAEAEYNNNAEWYVERAKEWFDLR